MLIPDPEASAMIPFKLSAQVWRLLFKCAESVPLTYSDMIEKALFMWYEEFVYPLEAGEEGKEDEDSGSSEGV